MNELTTAEIASLLRASAAQLRAEIEALPGEVVAWHPAPGEWCAKECIGHLIEAERRGFAGRVRYLLENDGNPALTSWDQTEVARSRHDCAADARALLDEFLAAREASVALVESLGSDDLERGGEHPEVGHLTVGEVVAEWVHHDRNHVKQVMSNSQARIWGQMGTAQRFSLPR